MRRPRRGPFARNSEVAGDGKRAFLIIGQANSGNRLLRRAFMAAGCYSNTERGIKAADLWRGDLPDKIVIARSGVGEEDFEAMVRACHATGYLVTVVLPYRKTDFAIEGQVLHYPVTREEARKQREEVVHLTYRLAAQLETPLVVIPYEPFVTSARVRKDLFESLGLANPEMKFFNANEGKQYRLKGPPLPY